jgi:hypothetical protein
MKMERAVLSFSPDAIRKPVTYLLVSNYKLRLNILRAKVMPGEEGRLLLELRGASSPLVSLRTIAFSARNAGKYAPAEYSRSPSESFGPR